MSNYATKQDLLDRFGETELVQLTDRTSMPPSAIDDTVVDQALNDASAQIDGYLVAAGYALPLASIPHRLVKVASDIARYFLHGKAADETVRDAYDDGIKWLTDVSKGIAQLGLPTTGETPVPQGGPQSIGGNLIFGDLGKQGF